MVMFGRARLRRVAVLVALGALVAGCTAISDGFESGDLRAWAQEHNVQVRNDVAHAGSYAADVDATTGPAWAARPLTKASSTISLSAAVQVLTAPDAGRAALLSVQSDRGAPIDELEVDAQGRLLVHDDATGTDTSTTTVLELGRWYVLQLDTIINARTLGVKVDGTQVVQSSNVDLGTAPAGWIQIGDRATNVHWHAVFDDVTFTITEDGQSVQPQFPIRAAFYYPWFPESWTQGGVYPFTNYNPTLGFYSSRDLATVQSHIRSMKYGGMRAGIASWWGRTHWTNTAIPTLLQAARNEGADFRWALYYEAEGNPIAPGPNPTSADIASDLTYIWQNYAQDDMYLKVNGRPVVFAYGDEADTASGCAMSQRWVDARNAAPGNFYIVLKVFPQNTTCPAQPDNWHQYAPANATDNQGTHSFTISPGFWLKNGPVRLARDPARWAQNVAQMRASNANFELVTTFNEWGEGTAVESAAEWASPSGQGTYLDTLHASLFDNSG
jgi:hypothetical protein